MNHPSSSGCLHRVNAMVTIFGDLGTPGTDVMIFKIFSPIKLAKKIGVFYQTTASFCKKIVIITLFF
jgi:hypothetical protein